MRAGDGDALRPHRGISQERDLSNATRPAILPENEALRQGTGARGRSHGAVGAVGQRIASSASQKSGLSDKSTGAAGDGSGQPETPADKSKDKDEKRRKRLSSIKGFVRRISDQGVLTRSNSMGKTGSGGKSPMGELDEASAMGSDSGAATPPAEADKKKKRMSLQRAGSSR